MLETALSKVNVLVESVGTSLELGIIKYFYFFFSNLVSIFETFGIHILMDLYIIAIRVKN